MVKGRTFKLKVIDPSKVIYDGEVKSLFVKGDLGEFELLPYHYPLMSVVMAGNIILDWDKFLTVKDGLLKFSENECVIVTE